MHTKGKLRFHCLGLSSKVVPLTPIQHSTNAYAFSRGSAALSIDGAIFISLQAGLESRSLAPAARPIRGLGAGGETTIHTTLYRRLPSLDINHELQHQYERLLNLRRQRGY